MRKTLLSRLNAVVLALALLLPCVMTVPVQAAGDSMAEPISATVAEDATHLASHITGATELTADLLSSMVDEESGKAIVGRGTYYLSGDMTAPVKIIISGEVVLCLNDNTLTAPEGDGYLFTVPAGSKLTIHGGDEGEGVIMGRAGADTKCIYIGTADVGGGEVVLDSGTITNFHSTSYGAGVHIYGINEEGKRAHFTMNGGAITGNSSKSGGAVAVNISGCSFTMNGGIISNNTAIENGGGVWANAGTAIVTLNGGTITGNTAGKAGGGVYSVQGAGSMPVSNTTITDNTAVNGGNDVYLAGTSSTAGILMAVTNNSVIGDVHMAKDKTKATKMSVTDSSVEAVSVNDAWLTTADMLTINSGTFGFDPTGADYSGWVTLADGVVCTKLSENQWKVAAVENCAEHGSGTGLTQANLEDYLVDGEYILPSGVYYLAEDITVDKRFVFEGESKQVTLCLNGKKVYSQYVGTDTTNNSAPFYVSGAKLVITDSAYGSGAFVGNGQSKWLYMTAKGGDVTLSGGTISGFASGTGGAVRMGAGTFTMSGGLITGNTATESTNGGAFYCAADTKLIMTGGEISGNTAGKGGAAIFLGSGSLGFTMTGGTIGTNYTTSASYTDLHSGSNPAIISGGLVTGTYDGTNLCITGGTFASDPTEWKGINCEVTQDGDKYIVTVREGMCPIHAGTDLNAYLAGGETDLVTGTYYLSADVTAASNITVSGEAVLCLNDHTLTAPDTGDVFITVAPGASLTICGGHEDQGVISGCGDDAITNAVGIKAGGVNGNSNSSYLTLNGGTITGFNATGGNSNAPYGAGIYVGFYTEFTMNGGTITGNKGKNGGGVGLGNGATAKMYMNGGSITGNTANNGAGVYQYRGVLTMSGGDIANNEAASYGGGLYVGGHSSSSATFTLDGGTISGNRAPEYYGGGIYQTNAGATTIKSGVIENNTATQGGGYACGGSGKLTVSGGRLVSNEADEYGGGIWINGTGAVTISGGYFESNVAGSGGGAFMASGKSTGAITISGGTFYGNSTTAKGGAIYYNGTGSIAISDGLYEANTANDGGVIYVNSAGAATISGGTYVENHAANIGGFMRTAAATNSSAGATKVSVIGGVYVNNTADSNNQTFYLGVAGSISGVTVVSDSNTIINSSRYVTSGKFSKDPSNRLAKNALYSAKDIDETITVNGKTYALAYEVVEGFAESGGHINFGSGLDLTLLLRDPSVDVNPAEYTLTVVQKKWTGEGTEDVTLESEFTTVQLAEGVETLALVSCGIAAKEMRDEITFTVTDAGDKVCYTKTVSLYDIAKGWYDDQSSSISKTMLADMLNYGAEAMRAFGYSNVTDEQLPGTTGEIDWASEQSNAGVTEGFANKVAYTLSLKDKIELNVYFDGEVAEQTVTGTVAGGSCVGTVTTTSNGTKTISKVTFGEIDVVNAKEDVTFTVTLDGTPVTVTYSIKDYVVQTLNGSQSAVVQALQRYVESVSAYISANS